MRYFWKRFSDPMKRFLFILQCIIVLFASSAQAYYFRSYQMQDGLSHNSVWAVMQDSRGFMWFGTNNGLNRFDGKHFKVFKNEPDNPHSIGNNFIHCLKEDTQGRFFVGTKKGLYLYDAGREQFTSVPLERAEGDEASVNDIFESPDGELWVACHGQGLYVLNADLSVKKHFVRSDEEGALPCDFIWTIVQDYVGNVWLGTDAEGLIHFDPKKEHFTRMDRKPGFGIGDPTVYTLYCDADYNLWAGTSRDGLYRYNYRTGKVSRYLHDEAFNIKSIIEYSDHELVMGCDKGLVRIDRETGAAHFMNTSFDNMTDNSIFSIARDHEGAFWIGTYFGGVNYFSPVVNTFSYYYTTLERSFKKSNISSFAEGEGQQIWVGSYDNGLSLFNAETKQFEPVRADIGYHNIQELYYDDGYLYISQYGQGIKVLDTRTGRITELAGLPGAHDISRFVTTIFKSSKGQYFFASEESVSQYDPVRKTARYIDDLDLMFVKDIMEDYNGAIWFATHSYGLRRLNADGTWSHFLRVETGGDSLPVGNVNCLYQDARFRIWAGTESQGLLLYNAKKNCFEQVFTQSNGLPSNMVYSIQDDAEGNLWLATERGLTFVSNDLKRVEDFGFLGDAQQIHYNVKAVLRASDNHLYFGGTNGFIAFYPKDITRNQQKPALAITQFAVPGQSMQGMDFPKTVQPGSVPQITLERKQSTFIFDFVALSYVAPTKNQYAYMLEGFDTGWNYTTDNRAYYMNIPQGKYTFRVRGTNNDGIWSDELRVRVKVNPPVMASPLMIGLYIVLGIVLVTGLLYRYKRHVEKLNREKLFRYKREKEKEIYQSKINFFTSIAHEIRTPLSLITAPLENILKSGDGNARTKSNLGIIKVNVNRLLDLINQLLDFRKVEENMFHFEFHNQDIVGVVRDVYAQYCQHAKLNGIDMNLDVREEPIKLSIDTEAIYKIVSNLVSNAVKYAKSRIDITVEAVGGNACVSVADDGTGIDPKYADKIFEPFFQVGDSANGMKLGTGLGLSLAKSLAKRHGGELVLQREEGKGCVFVLRIPLVGREEVSVEPDAGKPATILEKPLEKPEPGRKILVVEDNRDLREFLVNSLHDDDFIVFEAGDGVEALAMLEKESIDVIISDIMMPNMDGLELCRRVKTDAAYSHLPFILLSAKTDTSTKVDGLNKGADVYLEKPFSYEQLKAQVNSIIENRNHIRDSFIQSPLHYFKQHATADSEESVEFIEKLNACILENLSNEHFTIEGLSDSFFMSRSNFHKKIKNLTGMTPNDYIKLIRLNQSAQLLMSGKYKINEVCYMVGFNTPSYFSKLFYEHFGKSPKDFYKVAKM